ncbi:transmembrane 9 superfamily member 7-like [Olea europaea var. sylvestris]|uniref:transmembrane 9 superfamily member 7-like n=1 Tax=Olea europaea var. sylvestris TaxID=158386 RepID=UPI000C1D0822|nr:transmembrane 9 superfamily member 7-like [Olea europaea var. sylvestris]
MGRRISGRVTAIYFCLLLVSTTVHSFYLPGVAPRDFQRGDELQVKVNKLSSTKTQLPYDFYYLKYCKPKKIMNVAENLGEVLRGDRIENSIYTVSMHHNATWCLMKCPHLLGSLKHTHTHTSGLLCVYVGTGVQILVMTLVTMMFALLGFLSPSNRGGLMTAMVLLWVFMGLFAGYSSARLYKMFKGTEWKRNTLKTAFMFPGILFAVFFVLNALIWGEKSSGAVPFGTMFALVCLWFGISVPLVFVGSYLGFKKPAIEDPVKTNKIPRQIAEQAWYMKPMFSILIGGILPFGAVFIELFFILTSIWLNQFYYIFGFLFIVFVILIITCAEITIVLCYFQLCSEDYHWWWRAYLTAGSSALYLFLYSIFYFFTKLEITKLVSGILYFGYMLIASYAFFVLTGTIGFCACFWFVRKIYSSVKID